MIARPRNSVNPTSRGVSSSDRSSALADGTSPGIDTSRPTRAQVAWDIAYQEGVDFFGSQDAFQNYLDNGGAWLGSNGKRLNPLNEKKSDPLLDLFTPVMNSIGIISSMATDDYKGALQAGSAAASQGYIEAHNPRVTMTSAGDVLVNGQPQGNVVSGSSVLPVSPAGEIKSTIWLWLIGGLVVAYLLYRVLR